MKSCWIWRRPGGCGSRECSLPRCTACSGDDRSDALVENFTGQWLQLRNLEAKAVPDLLQFPDFDDNTRKGFRKETELFFGYILRDDRSALDLLNADYTFVDERLARHYGIPGVYGPQFRRVKLTDPNRRGLLGQGEHPLDDFGGDQNLAGFRGKYVLSTFLEHAPASAAAERSDAGRKQQGRRKFRRRCARNWNCTARTSPARAAIA